MGYSVTLKLNYRESLTLTVFSLTHKRKGPRVSVSLKKFLNGDAACVSVVCVNSVYMGFCLIQIKID